MMEMKNLNLKLVLSGLCLGAIALCFASSIIGFSLYMPAPQLSIKLLKYSPVPAETGKELKVWIKVDNTGTEKAENVTCKIIPEYPFTLKPGEKDIFNIGILPAGETYIKQVDFLVNSNAYEGYWEFKVVCSSGKNVWIEKKINLYVEAKHPKLVIGIIRSNPEKIVSDLDNVKLSVEIENIGKGDAKNVIAKIYLPKGLSPSFSMSDTYGLGDINSGESKDAIFYVDVAKNIEPGYKKAIIQLKYADDSGNEVVYKTVNLTAWIMIAPSPNLEVVRSYTVPAVVSPGSKADLYVVIKNAGEKKASEVSLLIIKNSNVPISFDKKFDYIGDLEKGETGTGAFEMSIDKDALPKTYQVKVEARYLVDGVVKTKDMDVSIKVVGKQENESKYIKYGILIVLALIIIGLIKKFTGKSDVKKDKGRR